MTSWSPLLCVKLYVLVITYHIPVLLDFCSFNPCKWKTLGIDVLLYNDFKPQLPHGTYLLDCYTISVYTSGKIDDPIVISVSNFLTVPNLTIDFIETFLCDTYHVKFQKAVQGSPVST